MAEGFNSTDDESALSDNLEELSSGASIQLPQGYQFFLRQAGGHHYRQGGGKIGVLQNMENFHVLKHLPYPHSHREATFYDELVRSEKEGNLIWPSFIPRYYGKKTLRIGGSERPFIELDDFTAGLRYPNILDVKLGGVYKPGDTDDRIAIRASKYPFYQKLGFRLDGCQIYDRAKNRYSRISAKRNKTMEELKGAIRSFLKSDDPSTDSTAVVRSVRPQLERVEEWLSKQNKWQFYSVSTLVAYESSAVPAEQVTSRVAFVDFVHVFPAEGADETCIRGLRSLISFLEENAAPERQADQG